MTTKTEALIEQLNSELTATEDYTMPSAEALLAGTLALMTGHAQACCEAHRDMMARKIMDNLFYLAQHPVLSPDFKTMLWNLRTHWEALTQAQAVKTRAGTAAVGKNDGPPWQAPAGMLH